MDRQALALGSVWAPYYVLDKLGRGLLDAYRLAGIDDALDVLVGLADHVLRRVERFVESRGSDAWFGEALSFDRNGFGAETGGFNELAWDVYAATGEARFVKLASLFEHPSFLGKMVFDDAGAGRLSSSVSAAARDLAGRHANFHEPVVNGAASRFAHTGEFAARNATLAFLGALRASYAYATSLTCDAERWQTDPGALSDAALSTETQETCAGVNLARLARRAIHPPTRAAAEWSDYAERAATHGASQAQRGPGELLYTTPLGMASRKGLSGHGWGAPTKAFWCCYGTGAEALAKLPDGTFFRARGGAPEPGLDAGDGANARRSHVVVHERDTVYVARATVSAAAAWREAGAEVAVVADAFVLADAELGGGGDDVREKGEEERGEGEASAKIHRGAPCEGCLARGGFATVTRVRVRRFEPGAGGSGGGEEEDAEEAARDASSAARDASSRDPLAVRLLVPGWSRGAASGLAPSILLGGRPLRAAGCRPGDRPPTWCEVSREWAEFPADSEELVAAFPMVLRAEPLLGSDDENAFESFERGDPFAEGSRSTNTGPVSSSLRHAIVAGPAVLAALGPGAWIGDLRVPPPDGRETARGGASAAGGYRDGAGELTRGGIWPLDANDGRERVALRVLEAEDNGPRPGGVSEESQGSNDSARRGDASPRFLAAMPDDDDDDASSSSSSSAVPGSSRLASRASPLAVEPLLAPSADGAPGGSGFFYRGSACDEASCPNAMADAVSATWTLVPAHCRREKIKIERIPRGSNPNRERAKEDDARADAFFLEPAGAPGLRLALARDEEEETPGEENEALRSRGEDLSRRFEDLFAAPLELASAASTRHAPLAFRVGASGLVHVIPPESDDLETTEEESESSSLLLCAGARSACRDAGAAKACAAGAKAGKCVSGPAASRRSFVATCARACGACPGASVRVVRAGSAGEAYAAEGGGGRCSPFRIVREGEGEEKAAGAALPWSPPRGTHVALGPDAARMPYVLMAPLAALVDEVYTVYVRLLG